QEINTNSHKHTGCNYKYSQPVKSKSTGTETCNAHNNILQMLTSTGILGLFLYLVHRVQTLYVIIKNRKTEGLFLGGCVLVGILMGIVSSIFFHIYFMAFYSVLLLTLEKSLKSEKE
nr:hypothetical protein [Clostridia bacterium]